MTFEELDFIADSYIPILLIAILGYLVGILRDGSSLNLFAKRFAAMLVTLIIVYGVMFLDTIWRLWPAYGLDYSTHTALGLGCVVWLAFQGRVVLVIAIASLFAYMGLMHYQEYHTLADMLSTAGILLPAFIWLNAIFNGRPTANAVVAR